MPDAFKGLSNVTAGSAPASPVTFTASETLPALGGLHAVDAELVVADGDAVLLLGPELAHPARSRAAAADTARTAEVFRRTAKAF